MLIALTGVPGVGKSRISEELKQRGYTTITIEDLLQRPYAVKEDIVEGPVEDGSRIVDVEEIGEKLRKMNVTDGFVVGHLSHWLSVDAVIVLRAGLALIAKRLKARGYSKKKVKENIEAEAIDQITIESLERYNKVYEIDCSYKSVKEITDEIVEISMGKTDRHHVGKIDFSEEVLDWF